MSVNLAMKAARVLSDGGYLYGTQIKTRVAAIIEAETKAQEMLVALKKIYHDTVMAHTDGLPPKGRQRAIEIRSQQPDMQELAALIYWVER